MKIVCNVICRVTELFEKGSKFEIPTYNSHHYENHKDFKVERKLVISKVDRDGDVGETFKESEWFEDDKTKSYPISFAGVVFVYNRNYIHIDQNTIDI